MSIEDRHLLFQLLGTPSVVGVDEREELAR